jgi:hypothetical protein
VAGQGNSDDNNESQLGQLTREPMRNGIQTRTGHAKSPYRLQRLGDSGRKQKPKQPLLSEHENSQILKRHKIRYKNDFFHSNQHNYIQSTEVIVIPLSFDYWNEK